MSCVFGLGCANARAAEPVALTGDNLKQIVPGSSIALDTPLNTVVPIRFETDGLMTGEAGSLASYLGAERDRGRWWIMGDNLCLKWFRWFDAERRCIQLRQDGDRIFWQEQDGDRKTGTATITAKAAPVPAKPVIAKPPTVIASVAAPPPPQVSPPVAAAPVTVSPPLPSSYGTLSIISRAEASTPPAEEAADNVSQSPEPTLPRTAKPANGKTASMGAKMAPGKPPSAKHDKAARSAPAKAPGKSTKSATAKASAKPAEPSYQVAGVDEDDVLNIRNGPSEEHEAIGEIPPAGRGVKIVGACSADWCPVTHGNTKGWVNRYYLAPEPPADAGKNRSAARSDTSANRARQ